MAAKAILPEAKARLVTLTSDGFPPDLPRGVTAHAAADWLLDAD